MEKQRTLKRNPGMDMVRIFAFFTVVGVHFFLNTDFYYYPVEGVRMYAMTLVRSFFMICVPLYMVLSGFLLRKNTVSKSYFLKIFSTVGIYLLASVACLLYKIFVLKESFTVYTIIENFFEYKNAPYSWYIEMYIGLFLLAPFLNVLYNGLDTKRKKQALILVMLLLTAGPSLFNIFVPELSWFTEPLSSNNYFMLVPDWWDGFYPVTYYFIGCYLNEYGIKLKLRYNILAVVFVFFAMGSFAYYRTAGGEFLWGSWQSYGAIGQVIQTVLVFILFQNRNYSKMPSTISKILKYLSGLTLGAYLVSWIFDTHFYTVLNNTVSKIPKRFDWFIVIVPLIFICSLALSAIINLIYNFLEKIIKKIFGFTA